MAALLSNNHLDLRDLQTFHRELDVEKHFDQDLFRNVAFLTGEIGEFVSAVRKLHKANNETEETEARNHVAEELADCLAYVVKLANYAGIDLQEAYVKKMQRNLKREWHPEIK